jgi:hypothetical protein
MPIYRCCFELPKADVVTLDRVVCCYPDFRRLLKAAAEHSQRALAFTYPRETWYLRVGLKVINLFQRLRKDPFRVFLHPVAEMHSLLQREGLAGIPPSSFVGKWRSIEKYRSRCNVILRLLLAAVLGGGERIPAGDGAGSVQSLYSIFDGGCATRRLLKRISTFSTFASPRCENDLQADGQTLFCESAGE